MRRTPREAFGKEGAGIERVALVPRPYAIASRDCYGGAMNPELRTRGYIPTKGLLEPSLAHVVYKTLLLKHWRGECFRDNGDWALLS